MSTITLSVKTRECITSIGEARRIDVSLPAPPWGHLDTGNRDETRPTARTIRGDIDIKRDPVLRAAWRMK